MRASPEELFGTSEPPPERRLLRAGPLSAVLEDGNLRDIRFAGVEVVRAVNYLARDSSWGTFKPELSPLEIEERDAFFLLRYSGLCGGQDGFSYRMTVRGEAAGTLVLEAEGVALADFRTNRTGFVVLHPAEAAGGRLVVLHADGSREDTRFPLRISADQPAFEIRALSHEPVPGLLCTVLMEGDSFEMEDQRNWADASFKTYVRPLSRPRPYVIAKGAEDRQRVSIRVEGAPAAVAAARAEPRLHLGPTPGRMPETAVFVDREGIGAAEPAPGLARILVARLDLRDEDGASALSRAAAFARASGLSLAVELVMDAVSPDREAEVAMRLLREAGAGPETLLPVARRDFKQRPSNTLPADECGVGALVDALRARGFAGRIGAGTPSYFTEFNRNPPDGDPDFVFFSVAAVVHAADDLSVTETLTVYPELVRSARALCPGEPVWLGPCTIGVRHNPYGADVQPNPHGGRVPSARFDPRQARLFGAAFAAGAAVQAALSGVAVLSVASLAGPFGLFDEDGAGRPILAVQRELTAAAGAECFALEGAAGVSGVAYRASTGWRALVANLSPDDIDFAPPPEFRRAALVSPDGGTAALAGIGDRLTLPAYRTAILF